MKIWYKEDDTLDRIILYLLLLNIFPIRWIDYRGKAMVLIAALIALDLMRYASYYMKQSFSFWFLLFLFYPLLNYAVLGGSLKTLARNLYRIDRGMLLIFFFCVLLVLKEDLIEEFLKENFLLFNIFTVMNFAVLYRQIGGDFRLTAFRLGDISQYYKPDLMSGLFGLFGTPCLAFFSVFILVYNVYYAGYHLRGVKRVFVYAYDLLVAGFIMWASVRNDNKGIFIILIIYLCILGFIFVSARSYVKEPQTRWIRIAGIIAVLAVFTAVIGTLAYTNLELFRGVVDMMIRKVQEGTAGSSAQGGGERIGMMLFMLEEPAKIPFGYGLGNYYSANQTALGFHHFGQSDFGTFLILGGFLFMILIGVFVFSAFQSTAGHAAFSLIVCVSYMIFAVYTQVYVNAQTLTISLLIFAVIIQVFRREKKKVIQYEEDRYHYLP